MGHTSQWKEVNFADMLDSGHTKQNGMNGAAAGAGDPGVGRGQQATF